VGIFAGVNCKRDSQCLPATFHPKYSDKPFYCCGGIAVTQSELNRDLYT
jgi:hypothetical protein